MRGAVKLRLRVLVGALRTARRLQGPRPVGRASEAALALVRSRRCDPRLLSEGMRPAD